MKNITLVIFLMLLIVPWAISQGNWQLIPSGTTETLKSISFPSPDTGYIVGMYGTWLKTVDGGQTWFPLSGGGTHFFSVCFTSNDRGYGVGAYGLLFQTTDGGQTFTSQVIGTASDNLTVVCFPDSSIGYIKSFLSEVYKSTDGGLTWSLRHVFSIMWAYDMYF